MKLLKPTLTYIAAHIIDTCLTLQGLSSNNEGNPIMLSWMKCLGTTQGIIVFKALMTCLILFAIVCIRTKSKRESRPMDLSWVLYGGALLTFLCSTLWLI
jgi:hypothetical protein